MKAYEIMNELFSWAPGDYTKTCDTLKAGSPDKEVRRVAVCCFPEVNAIKAAAEWGADLFITHEPFYHDHWDKPPVSPAGLLKKELIEKTGMTVYRYHDHPHMAPSDLICEGELKALELKGTYKTRYAFGQNQFILDEPVTARELAKRIEEKLNIAHVRISGTTDTPSTKLMLGWGAPGGVWEALTGDAEIVIVGETCEWQMAEYARDASQLGMNKTLLILGHCGSERDGMKHISELLQKKIPSVEVRYFESSEVYTYQDSIR
ncbi:MAG: Nif3-like dinuclear metal center hexameric protein [Clostridia bacterium]|nr:Nif3-like dinuclear metal center hexameric protein [Clostridia bacterium]